MQDLTDDPKEVTMEAADMAKVGLIEMLLIRGSWTKADVALPTAWWAADQGPVLEGKAKLVRYASRAHDRLGSKVTYGVPLS